MIVTQISCQFRPEDLGASVQRLEDVATRNLNTPDCLLYQVLEGRNQPGMVFINQHWTDLSAFDNYRGSEEFASMITELKPLMTQPPQVDVFDAVRHG